jgi:hypothetical protein
MEIGYKYYSLVHEEDIPEPGSGISLSPYTDVVGQGEMGDRRR